MERMHHGGTAGEVATGRAWVRESITPLGAACAWLLVVAGGGLWPPLARFAGPVALVNEVLLVVFALHALHEAGHVVAGLLVGLPFSSVTIGLLTLRRERRAGRWCFTWGVNRLWRRVPGCVEREVTPGPGTRAALTVAALGGPVASVVAGVLLLATPAPWAALASVSLVIGVLNAVTIGVFGQASDGMIVWRLWSRRPADVAWRVQLCGDGAGSAVLGTHAP